MRVHEPIGLAVLPVSLPVYGHRQYRFPAGAWVPGALDLLRRFGSHLPWEPRPAVLVDITGDVRLGWTTDQDRLYLYALSGDGVGFERYCRKALRLPYLEIHSVASGVAALRAALEGVADPILVPRYVPAPYVYWGRIGTHPHLLWEYHYDAATLS